ncbi:MAG: hypothetical protein J0J06_05420 [Sphingomonas sp.]|uniref:hypothetical protein n=1 Tax=Sphingomonas sp. TaxID=28214 RepID=UPI001ACB9EDE|nr:hypothetical protein [Sphingomonas sp.]MBN8814873.1 hypothetical protein [Sphingomonas sp.]
MTIKRHIRQDWTMAIAPEAEDNDPEPGPGEPAPAEEPVQPAAAEAADKDAPPAPPDPQPDTAAAAAAATAAAVAAVVSADPNLVSTTVALPLDALEFLRSESTRNGTSTGDELRRSIGTQKFLRDKIAEGATLQLRDAKGNLFDVKI